MLLVLQIAAGTLLGLLAVLVILAGPSRPPASDDDYLAQYIAKADRAASLARRLRWLFVVCIVYATVIVVGLLLVGK